MTGRPIGKMDRMAGKNKTPEENDNAQLAVEEGFIKQEQDIVISSYGSIVGCSEIVGGSNATTIYVTDGYEQETIEIEERVNVKIEMNESIAIEDKAGETYEDKE